MAGWVKNWRAIDDNPWLQEYDVAAVFQKMIRLAQREERDVYCGRVGRADKILRLKRGQLFLSPRAWATKHASYKRIRTILKILEEGGLISTNSGLNGAHKNHGSDAKTAEMGAQTGAQITIVTICNYDKYQGSEEGEGAQTGAQWARKGRAMGAQNQEEKNLEEGGEESLGRSAAPKPPKKRGTRLPDGWLPSARNLTDAQQLGLSREQLQHEADRFRDYWISAPGARGVKADWDATWRNWCRKAAEQAPRGKSLNGANHDRSFVRAAQRALERDLASIEQEEALRGPDGTALDRDDPWQREH